MPVNQKTPRPFQPLTRKESLAILLEASLWLRAEATATLSMPDGPSKQRLEAELGARDTSLERDFQRLNA